MKKLLIVVVILLILSIMPGVVSGHKWASNIYSLVIIACFDESEDSINPFKTTNDSGFLTSDVAMWILQNLEYPYESCDRAMSILPECGLSPITWAGRSVGAGTPEKDRKALKLVNLFIEKGYDLNSISNGMAAAHEAVMFNQPAFLKVLLASGANPYLRINSEGKDYDEMNAFELYEYSKARFKSSDYSEIGNILVEYKRPNNGN